MAWFRYGFSVEAFALSALWAWALLVGLARRSYLSPFYGHWLGDFGTGGHISLGLRLKGFGYIPRLWGSRGFA